MDLCIVLDVNAIIVDIEITLPADMFVNFDGPPTVNRPSTTIHVDPMLVQPDPIDTPRNKRTARRRIQRLRHANSKKPDVKKAVMLLGPDCTRMQTCTYAAHSDQRVCTRRESLQNTALP